MTSFVFANYDKNGALLQRDQVEGQLPGTLDSQILPAYVLEQSAVPVMTAQSGNAAITGIITPGGYSAASTLTLSATSGAGVTATFGSAILTGTASDVGKQITFADVGAVYRSMLVTAAGSTTSATVTLASTFSSTSISASSTFVGNPLPTNYTGGIWVYLPAGAVSGGAAGFYWCVATSTATANGILQVTTAYQATMGVPKIPTGFVNATGSGANFTGVTTVINVATVTVPGGAMGANGALRLQGESYCANTVPGKLLAAKFQNGQYINYQVFSGSGTYGFSTAPTIVRNRGSQADQFRRNAASVVGSAITNVYESLGPVNTAVDQPIQWQMQINAATDYIVLEGFTVEILPRA